MYNNFKEWGFTNPLLIAVIILSVLLAGLAGFSVWSYGNYLDQKNNTDKKISTAVTKAVNDKAVELEKNFFEREKQPYTKFVGPDDLGHITFEHPKTYSVHVANAGTAGTFQAFLNPQVVPPISNEQPFAVRVEVADRNYEVTLKSYEGLVKKGTLKSTPITIKGVNGVRLDGQFSKQRAGSSVIFKIRDKSLIISTDADAFKNDFDKIVLESLDFNP